MGRSLHNKIHLGRRNALLNIERVKVASIVSTATVATIAFVITKLVK